MDLTTVVTDTISWELEGSGKFQAELINNQIQVLDFKGLPGEGCDLTCKNEKHLRNIHKALTALFAHMDKRHEQ